MREKEPLDNKEISHTYCPQCKKDTMDELKTYMKEIKTQVYLDKKKKVEALKTEWYEEVKAELSL